MALNTPPGIERADGTKLIVGDQGEPEAQEPDSGKPVHRKGGTGAEADIDIGTQSNPTDLDGGANDFDSGERNVGGSEALAGEIKSQDNANFNVLVDWLDSDGNVLTTHDPSALQGVSEVEFNLISRSDRFKVRVEDASGGQNRVEGTVNAH